MAPSSQHVVNQLRHLIYYHLDNNLVRNALFLAGRLQAYDPRSAETTYLMTLCHIRMNQWKLAFSTSKAQAVRGTHIGCAYVYAQACLSLKRFRDGITALEKCRSLWSSRNNWNKHSDTTRRPLPDAAAFLALLGKLWHTYGDVKKAVECYVESLKLNPFMWDVFQSLCDMGIRNFNPPNIFKTSPAMAAMPTGFSGDDNQKPPGTSEDQTNTNRPLQSQSTSNHGPSNGLHHDPFGPLDSVMMDEDSSNSRSFRYDKPSEGTMTHLSSNIVTGSSIGKTEFGGLETPTAPISASGSQYASEDTGDSLHISNALEPPHVPRKPRSTQAVGLDVDASSRIRPMGMKARAKTSVDQDESTDQLGIMRSSSTLAGPFERKRTITGLPTHSSSTHTSDPTNAPQRRSVRLFNQIRPTTSKYANSASGSGIRDRGELKKVRATGTRGRSGPGGSNVGRIVSGNRKPPESQESDSRPNAPRNGPSTQSQANASSASEASKHQEALQWILDLFSKLGTAYFGLSHFKCDETRRVLETLPQSQRETPWVLAQFGRAHYEMSEYMEAEHYFRRMRGLQPMALEYTEVYSTVLWHLKNEVELSYLAHELVGIERLSPQAWCAVGNTFSLQKDHDQALKCFKRATQLEPTFAYAFTLQGHEYFANDEFDKALAAYRSGVAVDSRHYNAWYGLGKVYERMGRYDVSEKHFQTAVNINPTNSVLIFSIGMALEKLKDYDSALMQYEKACIVAPRFTAPRFKKAKVLMSMHDLEAAFEELQLLKDIAPDDANVHFLLGRVFNALHRKADAIKHFTIALNLDPKAGQAIKEAISALEHDLDVDDDGAMTD